MIALKRIKTKSKEDIILDLERDWRKYRLALNQIAHPSVFISKDTPQEIARKALPLGFKLN